LGGDSDKQYISASSSHDAMKAINYIVDNLQEEAKSGLLERGLKDPLASQLSTILRVTITLNNDQKFTIGDVQYLEEKDVQNLECENLFKNIEFNFDDYNRGVVLLGNLKLNDKLDYSNLFARWKLSIQSMFFRHKYVLDSEFSRSLGDKSPSPNRTTLLMDSRYATKSEAREQRKQIIFIEDINTINIDSLVKLISESRPLNISVVINIPDPDKLTQDQQMAIFANMGTYLIGNLSPEAMNLVIKQFQQIDKSKLDRLNEVKYGYVILSAQGELRSDFFSKPR
jgi:hypothetical protein